MPFPGRIFAGDEELGKKSDDFKSAAEVKQRWSWASRYRVPRIRRRRLALIVVAGLILYVFFKNIPTSLGPLAEKVNTEGSLVPITSPPTGAPPRPKTPSKSEMHYYEGPIKFYYLAASLRFIITTMGFRKQNANVLFAAGNLQSASRLIPIACEMSRWNRNLVHFAFMGREELGMEDIQEVNGATEECNVYWHDARPDYSRWSTDVRMEAGVRAALEQIHSFMHPQLYIVEENPPEEAFLSRGVRSQALENGKPVIQLPRKAVTNLMWLTRLSVGSLSAWQSTYIDILIQAPAQSSGSLMKLLNSIEAADYSGFSRPHLTIELPSDIDPPTRLYLENLVWPPLDPSGSPHASQVTLLHRIPRQQMGTEEASVRFLESFFPARPTDSHVLVLSPQVELSPLYYHYSLYHLLEYRYSSYASQSAEANNLVGISLDLPSYHLNASTPFSPPSSASDSNPPADDNSPASFLWQAPSSNAVLYFGGKWIEFHSFLTSRIAHTNKASSPRKKLISPTHPAWTEYLLELMRARGYSLLYPNLPNQESIATVHNELYRPPPEFARSSTSHRGHSSTDAVYEPFIADPALPTIPPKVRERPIATMPLMALLPNRADLPELSHLPLLYFDGELLTPRASHEKAVAYTTDFRLDVGHCKALSPDKDKSRTPTRGDDLFCADGNTEDGDKVDVALTDATANVAEDSKDVASTNVQSNPPPADAHPDVMKSTEQQTQTAEPKEGPSPPANVRPDVMKSADAQIGEQKQSGQPPANTRPDVMKSTEQQAPIIEPKQSGQPPGNVRPDVKSSEPNVPATNAPATEQKESRRPPANARPDVMKQTEQQASMLEQKESGQPPANVRPDMKSTEQKAPVTEQKESDQPPANLRPDMKSTEQNAPAAEQKESGQPPANARPDVMKQTEQQASMPEQKESRQPPANARSDVTRQTEQHVPKAE